MKRLKLLILPLSLMFVSCNTNPNNLSSNSNTSESNYSIVKFDLNYDIEDDIYLNQIIKKDQLLLEPKEPNRIDYVFSGWYEDEACINKFEGFNKLVESDLILYASWITYDSISDDEKIDRFINIINSLSGNVKQTNIVNSGLERYYSPVDYSFPYYQEIEYNRYKDITTVDYYDEGRVYKYGEEQFFYQDGFLYDIFYDIEGNGKNNELSKNLIYEEDLDSYINIGFIDLFGSLLKTLSLQIKDGVNSEELEYEFTLNYTRVNELDLTYSFELNYYTYKENADFGAIEEVYMMDFGLTFINGMIKRSTVTQQYMLGIQGEVQYVVEDVINATYETCDEYESFSGTRFNTDDYKN